MKIKEVFKSPNCQSRNGNTIKAVVIHYTGGAVNGNNFIATKNIFLNSNYKASSHYVIDRDGSIYRFVEDSMVAWHAGLSWKNGVPFNPYGKQLELGKLAKVVRENKGVNPNLYTIGIECVAYYKQGFSDEQYKSLSEIVKELCLLYKIPLNRDYVIGHEEIDYINRAGDPTNSLSWEKLFNLINANNNIIPTSFDLERRGNDLWITNLKGNDFGKDKIVVTRRGESYFFSYYNNNDKPLIYGVDPVEYSVSIGNVIKKINFSNVNNDDMYKEKYENLLKEYESLKIKNEKLMETIEKYKENEAVVCQKLTEEKRKIETLTFEIELLKRRLQKENSNCLSFGLIFKTLKRWLKR